MTFVDYLNFANSFKLTPVIIINILLTFLGYNIISKPKKANNVKKINMGSKISLTANFTDQKRIR